MYENYLVYNFDQHLAASSTFRLEILASSSPNHTIASKFRLMDSTSLRLTGSFDRESLWERGECEMDEQTAGDVCTLHVKVALYNNESTLVNLFILPVAVLDVNDQRPKFKSNVYRVNVSENLAARTIIPLEMPVDLDSDKFNVKECHLIANQSAESLFEVMFSPVAKSLSLAVNGPLDRENMSSYALILVCADGRFKARAQLVLDVLDANDNIPVLRSAKLNVSVAENTLRDKLVQIEAYDLDDAKSPNGVLVFSLPNELNSNELRQIFQIDANSGWLSLRQALDYEKAKRHLLKVKVEDKGPNSVPVYAEV